MRDKVPSYCPYPGQRLVCVKKGKWVSVDGVTSPKKGPEHGDVVKVKHFHLIPGSGVFLTFDGFKEYTTGSLKAPGFNALAFVPYELYQAELTGQLEKQLLSEYHLNRLT